jgi:hypothetical protein
MTMKSLTTCHYRIGSLSHFFHRFAGFSAVMRRLAAELFSARIERPYAMAFCYARLRNALPPVQTRAAEPGAGLPAAFALPSGISELPEPEVFAMMLVGLILLG